MGDGERGVDLGPEDGLDLVAGGGGGDDAGFAGRVGVKPPGGEPRGGPALADAVARLDGSEPMVADGLGDLDLLLDQALLQSQWREPFQQLAAAEPAGEEGGDGTRPRYLN